MHPATDKYAIYDAAHAMRLDAFLRLQEAREQLMVRTGMQASYWRREMKRRRRAYNEAKALTFAAAYGGTYTTRLNRREP